VTQVKSRLKKLEDQCVLRNERSLDTLYGKAQAMVKHTGLTFEDAANELVKDLISTQDLKTIISEVVWRYGREFVSIERTL
jgi:hypothetical protein